MAAVAMKGAQTGYMDVSPPHKHKVKAGPRRDTTCSHCSTTLPGTQDSIKAVLKAGWDILWVDTKPVVLCPDCKRQHDRNTRVREVA